MLKRKVLSMLGVGAFVAAGAVFGVAAPAQAVPSCVTVNISNSWSVLTTTYSGRATSGCNYSVRGKWQYYGQLGSFTGSCVTLPYIYSTSSASATYYNLTNTGSTLTGFVNC